MTHIFAWKVNREMCSGVIIRILMLCWHLTWERLLYYPFHRCLWKWNALSRMSIVVCPFFDCYIFVDDWIPLKMRCATHSLLNSQKSNTNTHVQSTHIIAEGGAVEPCSQACSPITAVHRHLPENFESGTAIRGGACMQRCDTQLAKFKESHCVHWSNM